MTDHDSGQRFVGHYTLERADYAALIDAMRRQTYGLRTILVVLWISVLVLIIGVSSRNWTHFMQTVHDLMTLQGGVSPAIYAVIFGVLVLIAVLPQIIKWRALRAYRSFAIADKAIDITLDEAGFVISTKGSHGGMEWPMLPQVLATPEHLILVYSKREAVAIPRRAFANAQEFAAATALARRKVPAVRLK